MSGLPPAFSYYVNSLGAGVERNSVRIVPDNGENASNNSSITFTLPTDSVIDLNSLQFTGKFELTNAVDASANVAMPQAHSLFRSVQWALNGNVVCGNSNQSFGQVYEALRRATTDEQDATSRMSEYANVPIADSNGKFQASLGFPAGTAANTGKYIQFNDFMGLQRCPNAGAWDTAIFGQTRLHLYLESDRINLYGSGTDITQNTAWRLTGVEMRVDVLRIPPAIDDIIASRLASGSSLDTVFPEIYAQVSSADANVRCSIASNSLDMLGFMPLRSDYGSATRVAADDATLAIAAASSPYGAHFNRFNMRTTGGANVAIGNETVKYNWVLNGRTIPASGKVRVEQGLEYTKDCFSKGVGEHNQLYRGLLANDGSTLQRASSYLRENALLNNTVVCHKLCLTAPAHETAERSLTGMNTQGASATIQLQTENFYGSDYVLIFGQTSAVLSAMAGQQVSVQY